MTAPPINNPPIDNLPPNPLVTNPPPVRPSAPPIIVNTPFLGTDTDSDASTTKDDDTAAFYTSPHLGTTSGVKKALIIVSIAVGIVFIIGALTLLVVVSMNSSSKHTTRRSRRARIYDDGDN